MRRRPLLAVLLALLFTVSSAAAQGAAIKIENAWARRALMGGQGGSVRGNGAVYMTVRNGGVADAIVGAATDAADVTELHETYESSGMSMMRQVQRIPMAAGQAAVLKAGGFHLMLIGLRRDLKPGDTFTVTLKLEKAGAVRVTAKVQ